jgi:hypothetical protein
MPTHRVGPTAATANRRRRVVCAGRNGRPCRKPDGGYTVLRTVDPPYMAGANGVGQIRPRSGRIRRAERSGHAHAKRRPDRRDGE